MSKNIIKGILIALILIVSAQIYSIQKIEAASSGTSSSGRRFSGGMITTEPSEKVTEQKSKCESGGICHGTCSNTWTDLTSASCGKKTFTLKVYSPKGASTDYCVPESAKGNGTISSGKLIIDAYTQPTSTQIGTCTCISNPYCSVVTVETVSVDLAHVTLFGTSKK